MDIEDSELNKLAILPN